MYKIGLLLFIGLIVISAVSNFTSKCNTSEEAECNTSEEVLSDEYEVVIHYDKIINTQVVKVILYDEADISINKLKEIMNMEFLYQRFILDEVNREVPIEVVVYYYGEAYYYDGYEYY
jgi:hypothetical protein